MNTMKQLALTLVLSASAAFANDHLTQVASQARDLAADYRKMSVTLKDKNFAPAELKQELQDAEAALRNIKTLLSEYQATGPQFNAAQHKDWKLTQDLVTLLDVFHERKSELLSSGNAQKQRNAIRIESLALLDRATRLEAAVLRLTGAKQGS